jgi:hypothetical protein
MKDEYFIKLGLLCEIQKIVNLKKKTLLFYNVTGLFQIKAFDNLHWFQKVDVVQPDLITYTDFRKLI